MKRIFPGTALVIEFKDFPNNNSESGSVYFTEKLDMVLAVGVDSDDDDDDEEKVRLFAFDSRRFKKYTEA